MEPAAPETANIPTSASFPETAALLMKQMRPKQWVKNLIVYMPLLFSGKFTQVPLIIDATGIFVGFCLVSSSIYIMNDIVDVESDRVHPTKRNRPIASGRLSIPLAAATAVISFLVGTGLAYIVRPSLLFAILSYIIINLLYSYKLKHVAILDTFCIASGFVIRAVAGAMSDYVEPSSWFLLCTTLGALFIGMDKRRQELKLLDAAAHRKVLESYSPTIISRMEAVILPTLVTSYSFYSFLSPHGQWMMITVPIVLYGVFRYQILSEQGTSTGAPEEVFWRDRPIQLTILLWVLTCALVIYGSPGAIVDQFGSMIDSFRLH